MLTDIRFDDDGMRKPVILFIHGFKGFKDWGYWNLMADFWAQQGFVVVKPNLSHNGTTPDTPEEFGDLEAFGRNNFSIELDDIGAVIDYLYSTDCQVPRKEMDLGRLFLVGHSRGGGLVLLKGAEDSRVKGLATMAAVADFISWAKNLMKPWKADEVNYVINGRTGQKMPVYHQLVDDVVTHEARLNIQAAVESSQLPLIIFHGSEDPAVPAFAAHQLKEWVPEADLHIIAGADHVFGGAHPWESDLLPEAAKEVAEGIAHFFHGVA